MYQWNLLDFFWGGGGSIVVIISLVCCDVVCNYISSAVVDILRSLEGRTFTIGVPDTPP